MLSSIHPLGEEGRGNRYKTTATAFFVGSSMGGALTGFVLGIVGSVLSVLAAALGVEVAPSAMMGTVMMVALLASGATKFGCGLPSLARQVDENWLVTYRGWVYGGGFGFQLGLGVVTYIRSAAVWVWLSTILALGGLGYATWAVMVGATFGLVRGSSIMFSRKIHSSAELIDFHRRLHDHAPRLSVRSRH